jgi:hypothetical protein
LISGAFPALGSTVTTVSRPVPRTQQELTPVSALIPHLGLRQPALQIEFPLIRLDVAPIRGRLPAGDALLAFVQKPAAPLQLIPRPNRYSCDDTKPGPVPPWDTD